MKKFSVKVTYKYSDTVEVFAETEEEAQNMAVNEAKESFECLHDIEVIAMLDTLTFNDEL